MLGNLLRGLSIISEKNEKVRKYDYADNVERKVVLGPLSESLWFSEKTTRCGVSFISRLQPNEQTNSRTSIVVPDFRIGKEAWESCEALSTAALDATMIYPYFSLSLTPCLQYVSFPNLQLVVILYTIIYFSEAYERLTFPVLTCPSPIFLPIQCCVEEVFSLNT